MKIIREFKLSSLAVDNKTTVFVLTFIIFIAGIFSYVNMPKENFPELSIPQIFIGTAYPGNSALDIEKMVSRPLEKEIKSISGVDKVTSTSIQGFSTVLVEFNFETETTIALQKVKDAVDKARSSHDFPKDLPAEPNVFELNLSEFPIMNINLSGDFSIEELNAYAEYLEDEIENLSEISKVEIRGVQQKEVEIAVDMHKMDALQINFQDIENAIQRENVTISGGDVLTEDLRRTVRIVGEFSNIKEIKNIIIKDEKLNIVHLMDIADVAFKDEESKSFAREYGKPVIMLDVVKRSGQNLLIASEKIIEIIATAQKEKFPKDLQVSVTNDQSKKTRSQVDNLENSIVSGIILVVLVLLFFLGLRNALFVGVAIPLSMFMAFMILGAMGVTLNLIVLFSLILALGMLVDNGIVVVENIYRLMDEGLSAFQAAKQGVGEVALPIITSTATTLAAFLPLAFWPGMMGEFMKYLPITLIIVLGSSLFVALVINPVLTATFMKAGETVPNKKKVLIGFIIVTVLGVASLFLQFTSLGNILIIAGILLVLNLYILGPAASKFQSVFLPKVEEKYNRFLTFSLKKRNPVLFFVGTFLLLIASFGLLKLFTPKVEFFPVNQPNYVNIFIEKPIGTDIESTNKATARIEKILINYLSEFEEPVQTENGQIQKSFLVESVIAQVGEGASDPSQGPVMGNTPHKARITVNFVEFQHRRGINTADVMENIRNNIKAVPGVQVTIDKNKEGPPRGKPVSIEVIGEDYDSLIFYAENIRNYINNLNVPGVEELKPDVELGKPELLIEIDRDKARRFGISTGQVGSSIRTALFGKEISRFKQGKDDYPINVRFKDQQRYNTESLLNQRITFRDMLSGKMRQVPISSIATPVKSTTFSAVKRKNLKRVITITSNIKEGYNPNETVEEIKNSMNKFELPKGYQVKFAGEQEDQAKEMAFLSSALMIAVFIIFLILVAQFNSAGTPFIIVASVVFSLIGVLLGLVIFQMDFVVIMTMIGIISLAGIVVNNAIVLIDYTNLLMDRRKVELGIPVEKMLPIEEIKHFIIEAGQKRLRPVLLTAITTILGLLPLALGMNINFFTLLSDYDPQIYFGGDNAVFWGPMSSTVIFGLFFATFLTLVIVPIMYYLMSKMKLALGYKK
ncbi:MAG: efflux RND transporter permease subunit [Bacteroidota bacterium]|nr:efflux RND transporter permease subunit [Bacteroidota bacterium]